MRACSAVAFVTLPWLRFGLCLLATVRAKGAAHIVHFLDASFGVAADEALVSLVRLHQFPLPCCFSFRAHALSSQRHPRTDAAAGLTASTFAPFSCTWQRI